MRIAIYRTAIDTDDMEETIYFTDDENDENSFEIPDELMKRYKRVIKELSSIEDEIKSFEPERKD